MVLVSTVGWFWFDSSVYAAGWNPTTRLQFRSGRRLGGNYPVGASLTLNRLAPTPCGGNPERNVPVADGRHPGCSGDLHRLPPTSSSYRRQRELAIHCAVRPGVRQDVHPDGRRHRDGGHGAPPASVRCWVGGSPSPRACTARRIPVTSADLAKGNKAGTPIVGMLVLAAQTALALLTIGPDLSKQFDTWSTSRWSLTLCRTSVHGRADDQCRKSPTCRKARHWRPTSSP